MATYYENLGACVPDKLINSGDVTPITGTATIAAGGGAMKRGTVLAMSTGTAGTGKLVILGSTPASNETLTAYGILCDDVDATADVVAEVYLAGHFNKNALIVKDSTTLTAADIKALRDGGIFLDNSME